MKNKTISYDDAQKLEIGTVLQFAKDSYSIVTDAGIRYFDYNWSKNKYPQDSVMMGVGIADEKNAFIQPYVVLSVPPIALESVVEMDKRNDRYLSDNRKKPKV